MKQTLLSFLLVALVATSCTKEQVNPEAPYPPKEYNLTFNLDGKDGVLVGTALTKSLNVHITFQDPNHAGATIVLRVIRRAGGEDLYGISIPANAVVVDRTISPIEYVKDLSIYSINE